MGDWINLNNGLYLMALILGAVATVKYRAVVRELKEAIEVIRVANADGTITKKEKDRIIKESLDVVLAILKVIWSPFKLK